MSVALMPAPKMQFLDNNGKPLAGGLISTFIAGTTTPLATYTDSTGSVSNANPVVLDAGGFANIWLLNRGYKIVVKDLNSVTQYTVDNVFGLASTTRILNYQKALAPIAGNSLDEVMYTYTLPAGTLGPGQGLRITFGWQHTTGAGAVNVKMNIGNSTTSVSALTVSFQQINTGLFINDPGSQVSNTVIGSVQVPPNSFPYFAAASVDTTVANTISATFNAANTELVTPQMFLIETI